MPAIIFAHPSSEVKLQDPREQPVRPSAFYAPQMPTPEQMDVLDATNGLFNLIEKYGAQRVMTWVRNLAAIAGQEVS